MLYRDESNEFGDWRGTKRSETIGRNDRIGTKWRRRGSGRIGTRRAEEKTRLVRILSILPIPRLTTHQNSLGVVRVLRCCSESPRMEFCTRLRAAGKTGDHYIEHLKLVLLSARLSTADLAASTHYSVTCERWSCRSLNTNPRQYCRPSAPRQRGVPRRRRCSSLLLVQIDPVLLDLSRHAARASGKGKHKGQESSMYCGGFRSQ